MCVVPRDPYVKSVGAAVGIPNITGFGAVFDVQDIVELALDLKTEERVALVLELAGRRADVNRGRQADGRRRGERRRGTGRCLLYTSPSPRDPKTSRMPSSA